MTTTRSSFFDVSSIPHKTINFQAVESARAEITDALVDRLNETNKILDARVQISASRIDPNALLILKELAGINGSGLLSVQHPGAYLQLLQEGIAELDRHNPFQEGRPSYKCTDFGLRVIQCLFDSAAPLTDGG